MIGKSAKILFATISVTLSLNLRVYGTDRLDPKSATMFVGIRYVSGAKVKVPKDIVFSWESLAGSANGCSFYVAKIKKGSSSFLWLAQQTGEFGPSGVYQQMAVTDVVRLPALSKDESVAASGCRVKGRRGDADARVFGVVEPGKTEEGENWRPCKRHAWRADLDAKQFEQISPENLECNIVVYGD